MSAWKNHCRGNSQGVDESADRATKTDDTAYLFSAADTKRSLAWTGYYSSGSIKVYFTGNAENAE